MKKTCLNLSAATYSSPFKWMEIPLVDLPEWIDLLSKNEGGGE
ncbi:MAG: hypothetical protein ACRDBM_09315 [Sporomusa sp.]